MNPVQLILLDSHNDRRGNLASLEDFPFPVKRIFHIYNMPLKEVRGGHAHKKCKQLLIAACGAVLVTTGDGKNYVLDNPAEGLYVPPKHLLWYRFLMDGTTLLVLASEKFDKEDYIRGGE